MRTMCGIYERTAHGVKVVAVIRDGKITGKSADSISKILERFGYRDAPMEDVIDQFLLWSPGMGAALFPPD